MPPVLGQHRSTQRRCGSVARNSRADALRTPRCTPSRVASPAGCSYRRAGDLARRSDGSVNRKRVQRLWREERLRASRRNDASSSVWRGSAVPAARLRAERRTRPGRSTVEQLRTRPPRAGRTEAAPSIVDEHAREAPASLAAPGASPPMPRPQRSRGSSSRAGRRSVHPLRQWSRAHGNALRDWCRFSGTRSATSSLARRGEPAWSRSTAGCATSSRPPSSRQPARGAGAGSGLAPEYNTKRPQQQPGLARPGCLRPAAGRLSNTRTLIARGLAKGVRSASSRSSAGDDRRGSNTRARRCWDRTVS